MLEEALQTVPADDMGYDATALEDRILLSATPIVQTVAESGLESAVDAPLTFAPETQAAITERRELVVIDAAATDYQQLIDDLGTQSDRQLDVIVLDAQRDGIEQISEWLSEHDDVDAIHIVSHAEDGAVRLGSAWLSESNFAEYASQLSSWSGSLDGNADLLLYGCDLAASESGRELLQSLQGLIGADVAASDDATGHRFFGGDWELEYSTGVIESEIAFSSALQQTWRGKLASITISTTADVVDGDTSSIANLQATKGADASISLREAILAINAGAGGDTIQLGAGTYTLSITGASENLSATGDLDILKSLTIVGSGASDTVILGDGLDRVLHVDGDSTILTASNLSIRGGMTTGNGGAIYLEDGTLNLDQIEITNNHAAFGAGIYVNAGADGNFTDVVLSSNEATINGGGVFNGGAAILNRVTVSSNSADSGAGIYHDGTLALTNVTVSGNTASASGGGLYARDSATIISTTFTLNHADSGGGIRKSSGVHSVTINNSIVSENTADSANPDVQGGFNSQGFNLIGDTTGGSGFGGTDITAMSANLGALTDNGGFSPTHALLTGSPAIDAGTAAGAPTTDARGLARDSTPDIGAYEVYYELLATDEFRTNTNTGNTQETALEGRGSHQAVAMDADGDYVVVWSSSNQDGSGWGIYAQRYDKDGVARGGELLVNSGDTAFDQKWATVGMDAAGNFVVAWTDFGALGDRDIMARRFDADGNALSSVFQVNDGSIYNRSSPSIAVADDGRFVIAWQGSAGLGDEDIFARRFDATGGALDGSDIVVEGAGGGDYDAVVAINNSGEFAVLWDDGGGVKVQRFNANGTTNGGQITVDGSGNAGNGSLAMHSDGSLVVTWREGASGSQDVRIRRYDNTGTAEGPSSSVATSTAGDQTDPSISMDGDGNYVVVWEGAGDQAGHSDTSGVFGQKFDATGAKVGDEFRINQTTSGTQQMASAAMLNLDNFVTVWSGNGDQSNQTDSSGVFARQFGTGTLPSGQLWFATKDDGDGGGETWTDSEILQFGDTGDAFDLNTGTTSGTISKLPGFITPYDIRALHFVESTVTLGTTGTQFTVKQGDLIMTLDPGGGNTGTAGGISVDRMDIVVFRPDTPGDYSSGTYSMLIDGDSGDPTSGVHDATKAYNVHAISLVERDTVVGGTTLTKGTLLVAHSDKSLHHNIYTMDVIGTGVGASTETSEVELLLSGQALGLDGQPSDPYKLQGLHLLQQTTAFSGNTLAAGTLMVVVEGPDTYAGQVVDQFDVVALTVTQTEQDTVAGTAATGTLLFDGTDLTINNPSGESLNGFTIVSSSFPDPNQTPTADAGGAYTIDEGVGLMLSAAGSSDPDGDTLSYKWDLDNDGLFGEVGEPTGIGATVDWATLQSFGIDDSGSYTIGLQVDDGNGGTHSVTTTLTVNDVAPVLNISGAAAGTEDTVYSLALSATDPGDDTVTQWTVDWGDGTTTTHNFAAGTATHTYTVGGNFSILVAATDEDGTHVQRDLLVAAYVTGQDDVYRFDAATGALVSTLSSSGGDLQKPIHALVGKNGDIYVSGFDSDNVVRYDSAGNYLGEFVTSGSGGLNGACGMAFDADGNLYVTSFNNNRILRYDASGNFVDVFGSGGSGMDGPSGIVFGPDGDLYVSSWDNSKLFKYDGTDGGSPISVIGSGLFGPDQLVFNSDGDLLIANGSSDNVKIYDGSLSTFASDMDNATGIALSPEGILYVANRDSDSITMFDATSGASLGTLVASGTGGLSNPYHLSWIPDHQVQIAHVADTPTVTDSTTNQETQTTTGLVISRNPADTAAVTHYKITNIADGVLYLNDGSTQINNGDFITVAQGAAGLKFTPTGGFAGPASFAVQASLTDNDGGLGGGIATANITVNAVANTAPSVSLDNVVSPINENTSTAGGLKVANIVITDDGNGLNTLGLSGADAAAFEIDGLELRLKSSVTLDYETKSSYDVTVTVDDASIPGSPDDSASITILLQDVDEFDVGAIVDGNAAANTVAENAATGAAVGITAAASDADATNNTITYSLDDDAGGRFTIHSTTGVVTVDAALDAETATSHTIVVRATSSDTSTTTKSFTINVADVNESNVSTIVDADGAANAVAENAAAGSAVGITASASDADVTNNTISYTLINDAAGRFTINATTGVVTVSGALDAEDDNEHTVVVRAFSSDGSFRTKAFQIDISDINESAISPIVDADGAANLVAENAAIGTVVGITTAAGDADVTDTVSYSLEDDAGGRFTINSSTGVVTVAGTLDAEVAISHNIVVRATSSDSSTRTQSFGITIGDNNDNLPVFTSSGTVSITENRTIVQTLSATDADIPAQTISFTLSGGADAGRFTLNASNQLVFLVAPDFESPSDFNADNVYEVEVTADDGAGGSTTQSIAVTVTDGNEAPSITAVPDQTLNEDQPSGVLTFTIGDLESAATGLSVTASSSNPAVIRNAGITLGGSGANRTIMVAPVANQSGASVITITVSDGTLTTDTSFVVTVNSVNDVAVGRNDRILVLDDAVTFTAADLMANDYDVDGDALTLHIVSAPEHGTLTDLGGGRFAYQADGDGDTFMTYRLFDGTVYSDPVTVRFSVPQIPVTPAALPPSYDAPAETSSEPSEPQEEPAPVEPQEETPEEEPTVSELPVVPNAPPQTGRPAAIDVAAGPPAGLHDGSQGFTWTLRSDHIVEAVVEVTERVLGEGAVSDNREEIRAAYATAVAQIRDAITQPQMWQAIDSMQEQIDSSVSTTTLTIGATVTATTSITVGYVVWVIRGGILLSSVMANLPMWRLMDPMAILNAVDGAEEDDESLESMVDEHPSTEPVGADA